MIFLIYHLYRVLNKPNQNLNGKEFTKFLQNFLKSLFLKIRNFYDKYKYLGFRKGKL